MGTKKIKTLVAIMMIVFTSFIAKGTGNTCSDAITVITENKITITTMQFTGNDSILWVKFVAGNSKYLISTSASNQTPNASLLYMSLYSGSCSNLNLIEKADLTLPEKGIFADNLVSGNTYYIKFRQNSTTNSYFDLGLLKGWADTANIPFTLCTAPCNMIVNKTFIDTATYVPYSTDKEFYKLSTFYEDQNYPYYSKVPCWHAAWGSPWIDKNHYSPGASPNSAIMCADKDGFGFTEGEGIFQHVDMKQGARYEVEYWYKGQSRWPGGYQGNPSFEIKLTNDTMQGGLLFSYPQLNPQVLSGEVVDNRSNVHDTNNWVHRVILTTALLNNYNKICLYVIPTETYISCVEVDSFSVKRKYIFVDNKIICNGSCATLTASGGTNYSWSTGVTGNPISVCPTVTTTYYVTGTNPAGCTETASAEVYVRPKPNVTITTNPNPPTICLGTQIILTASGATTYTWNNGLGNGSTKTVTPSVTTTYIVTGTNTYGCTNSASCVVTVQTSLPNITVNNPIICKGSYATLTASGGTSYTWSTGQTINPITVNPTVTTTYFVTGINVCKNTASSVVTVNPSPNVTDSTIGTVYGCCSGAIFLKVAGGLQPYSYSWSTGATTQNIYNLCAGSYSVTVTGNNGCSTVVSPIMIGNAIMTYVVPVGGSDAITIFGSGSNPQVITGANIQVNGNLAINENITFNSCNFFVENNSRINTGAFTLTLNNSVLKANCSNMWAGIYTTSSSARVVIYHSYIRDANHAVRNENNAQLNITYSTFECNYISLYLKNMTTSANFVYDYNTVNAGNLLSGGSGTKSYQGLYIYNCNVPSPHLQMNYNNFNGYFVQSIYVYNANVNINHNRIINKVQAGTGISITNTPTLAKIQNSYFEGPYIVTAIGAGGNSKSVICLNDTIYNFTQSGIAITTSNTTPFFDVENCYIDPTPNTLGTGISIQPSSAVNSAIRVMNNKLMGNNLLKYGIYVTNNNQGTYVLNNIIYFNHATSGAPTAGVYMAGCNTDAEIEYNHIYGNGSSYQLANGIDVENSSNSIVQCNVIGNTGSGMFFAGSTNPATLIGDTMYSCYDGIYLKSHIGTQGNSLLPSDNRWDAPASFVRSQILTDGSVIPGLTEAFYVRTAPTQFYPTLLAAILGGAYATTPSASGSTFYCDSRGGSGDDEMEKIKAIANYKFKYPDVESKWLDMYTVYSALKKNTDWTSQDIRLKKVKDSLEKTSVAAVYNYYEQLAVTGEQLKNNITKFKNLNNAIASTNLIEPTYKTVHDIFLNTFAQDIFKLSISDSIQLVKIANLCPYKYGNGVYEARAMLAMLCGNNDYVSICELKNTDDAKREEGENNDESLLPVNDNEIAKSIKVYPNPTKNNITIEYTISKMQNGQVEFYDIIGNKVLVNKIDNNANSVQISTNKLQGGIYTYKVIIDNNVVKVDKLVIIK